MPRHSRTESQESEELESLKAKLQTRYGLRMPREEMRRFLDDIEKAFYAPKYETHSSVPKRNKPSAEARTWRQSDHRTH